MGQDKGVSNKEREEFFVPLQKKRLSEEIYQQMREAIWSGRYKAGERLPSEKAFCERFRVGRAVIREALRLLENAGLIYVRLGCGGGVFVKNIDPGTLANTFEGIIRLSNVSLNVLTAARAAIEGAVLQIVMKEINEESLRGLQASIDAARKALEEGAENPMNAAFHQRLADMTENPLLSGIVAGLLELEAKFAHASGHSYERKKRFIDEHQQILDQLKAGQHAEACRAFDEHMYNSLTFFPERFSRNSDQKNKKRGEL